MSQATDRNRRIAAARLEEKPTVLDVEDLSDVLRISKERCGRYADQGRFTRLAYSPRRLLVWQGELVRFLAQQSLPEPIELGSPYEDPTTMEEHDGLY